MDKRNNEKGKKPVRSVTKTNSDYDWDTFDRKTANQPAAKKPITELERKQRYHQMMKRKRLKMQRIRAAVILALVIIALILVIFLTPLFDIRSITYEGNSIVTNEQLDAKLGDLVGQNIFKAGSGAVRKRLSDIAYIEDADASKRLLPPSVKVTIRECIPAAYFMLDGKTITVDSSLKVIDDTDKFDSNPIPALVGVKIKSCSVGKTLSCEDSEQESALLTCLDTMEKTGTIPNVISIDMTEMTGIEFNYDNRIQALCGTPVDLERKLRLFKETVTNSNLASNARGTIDLSVTGKAVYTP